MLTLCNICKSTVEDNQFFCDSCGTLQEIKISYFSIFGIEPSVDIDKKVLEAKFAELIKIIHPDRFIYKSADEKLIAEKNTSTINKAYQVLSSDITLCEYILNIIYNIDDNTILNNDNEFLMEKMELYDQLNSITSISECHAFSDKLYAIYNMRLLKLKNNIRKGYIDNQNKELQKIKFIQHFINALETKVYMLEMDEKL